MAQNRPKIKRRQSFLQRLLPATPVSSPLSISMGSLSKIGLGNSATSATSSSAQEKYFNIHTSRTEFYSPGPRRKLSRKASFLESKPMKSLAKLTRRYEFPFAITCFHDNLYAHFPNRIANVLKTLHSEVGSHS